MPFYVDDPENSGAPIDVVELQGRNPFVILQPYLLADWLKRDTWTRSEALVLLAGYDPNSVSCYKNGNGFTCMQSHNFGYLDGLSETKIREAKMSWRHPRFEDAIQQFQSLARYSEGQPLGERKSPAAWLDWAKSKDFSHYWRQSGKKKLANTESDEKPLMARERNDLYRVIRALAEMQKLPPKGYAESIQSQLEMLGLQAPSDDTIRNAIEGARALNS